MLTPHLHSPSDHSEPHSADAAEKHPFLVALGDRILSLRTDLGITRKALAQKSHISERHMANLEHGLGNVSALMLLELSQALGCTLLELLDDESGQNPERQQINQLLEKLPEASLRSVRIALSTMLGSSAELSHDKQQRIALIGMRGAGKTTLGSMLAKKMQLPFIELSEQIEKSTGLSIATIQDLYGSNAYRRYERRALEEAIQKYPAAVIATPSALVTDSTNLQLLLSECHTVWLKAEPEAHWQRVTAATDTEESETDCEQGQTESEQNAINSEHNTSKTEAIANLQLHLESLSTLYSQADASLDTSTQDLPTCLKELQQLCQELLQEEV